MNPQSEGMHRELRVVAMNRDQFGSVRVGADLAGHRSSLRLQIPKEARSCELGHEAVGVVDDFGPVAVPVHNFLVGHEQREEPPLGCRPKPADTTCGPSR